MSADFVYGIHPVMSLLQHSPQRVTKIIAVIAGSDVAPKLHKIREMAEEHHIPIQLMSRTQMDGMLADVNHQGVIAYHVPLPRFTENDIEQCIKSAQQPPLILILDSIQDPHNLGACLRCADAAGVALVIAPKDKTVGLTPAVRKVASGAAETIPFIQVTNLVRTIERLKSLGVWIYGTDDQAPTTIFDVNLSGAIAWVLGAEEKGMRRLTRENCDALVSIPMMGSVSSLNVSVATGICLFETLRQRPKK